MQCVAAPLRSADTKRGLNGESKDEHFLLVLILNMECSHLETSVDVSPAFIKQLTSENKAAWICSGKAASLINWPCPVTAPLSSKCYVVQGEQAYYSSVFMLWNSRRLKLWFSKVNSWSIDLYTSLV